MKNYRFIVISFLSRYRILCKYLSYDIIYRRTPSLKGLRVKRALKTLNWLRLVRFDKSERETKMHFSFRKNEHFFVDRFDFLLIFPQIPQKAAEARMVS